MTGHSMMRVAALAAVAALVGMPEPAVSQVAPQYDARTIRVSGVGEFRAQPNLATAQFGVETSGETAQEAAMENAERMDRVIEALVAAGIDRSEIQTSGYSLYPEYSQDRRDGGDPDTPRVVGYRAVNQVSVRTRDLEQIGELIDAALAAGANRLHGVAFEVEDEAAQAAQAEALTRAVAEARMTAETIARALGVQLGEVLDATSGFQPIAPVYRARAMDFEMAASAAPPTPIEPGEQTVHATASLVFAIE